MKRNSKRAVSLALCVGLLGCTALAAAGCSSGKAADGKITVEMVQYKPEAVKTFEELARRFNEQNQDIRLVIDSPNEAITILKTRFIRNDPPDIIGIGGDINYSYFLDADMLLDIRDFEGLSTIKEAYLEMDKQLEFVPKEGVYALPYAANAAGVLYNRELFRQNGWEIPETWDDFIGLCETIQASGTTPLYFGFKDTWTCLAPWNALAVCLVDPNIAQMVNLGKATFREAYSEVADKERELLGYCQPDPFAYGYNDACTAFARGESAMFVIGNYAVPQVTSVNPAMDIDSFVLPGSNDKEQNRLNSGNDLQFSVMATTPHKEACYRVLEFLLRDENVQYYTDSQNSVPCKEGDFTLSSVLDGMKVFIDEGRMVDYQDHHYPSEMSVDALIQTYLLSGDKEAFLTRFDTDWKRYNRDTIAKLEQYQAGHGLDAGGAAS